MSVAGIWHNELGSQMTLEIEEGQFLKGMYQTAVGDGSGIYPLNGQLDTLPNTGGQAVGFIVAWVNAVYGSSHSVTTWSGQYQIIEGKEILTTLWLLTSETVSSQDWASTNVGQDIFTRETPPPETIARRRVTGPASHPIK